MDEVIKEIDRMIADCRGRDNVPASEIVDGLLDIRLAVVNRKRTVND